MQDPENELRRRDPTASLSTTVVDRGAFWHDALFDGGA
jgi:hypothetical protein